MSNQSHISDETTDYLSHFGVKGMKWGVRKDRIPTEKTRNTTDMEAFNKRSPLQALSTKGVISKEEAAKVEKELDDLIDKESKAYQSRIDKIVDKHSSKIEKFEIEFEAKNGNRVLTDKELTSYNKTIKKLYDDMDSEIEKALTEKFSPKVTDLMTLYLTSETKKDVYRRRAEIAARGALVGIGGLTVLMSDNTGTNIQSPTLAEMEESLSHAVAKDFLSSKPKGDKKGKRAFDESMVKRDGSGQFAKQASAKKAGVDPKDADWMRRMTQDRVNSTIWDSKKNVNLMMSAYDAALKANGFNKRVQLTKLKPAVRNNILSTYESNMNRNVLPKIPEFKSPTGSVRVTVHLERGGDFAVRFVDKNNNTVAKPAIKVRPNAVDARVRHSESPSVAEMRDILEDDGEALSHFGIKGMKWGVRRSRKELARLRNDDGEDVGGLRASTRKAANKLRSMKPGETIVIDDGEKGPKIYTKQPDGTFKQTHLAADTERFMRTMSKDPSEMSTKEIQDATKRAKAVEEYNKMFNPYGDPNHELRLKAEAMKLEADYRKAYAQINPPSPSMAKKLGTFINDMQPAYNVFKAADKAVNGKFSDSFKSMFGALNDAQASKGSSGSTDPMGSTGKTKKTKTSPFRASAPKSKTSASRVYDITDLGKDDYLNPFIAELEGRRR